MSQTESSKNHGEALLNIFPNPCIGDTYLYTDDLEAAWVIVYDCLGSIKQKWLISPGQTLHVKITLSAGAYQLVLMDNCQNILGLPKSLFISE